MLLALLNVRMSAKAVSCSELHASLLCYGTLQKKHVNVRQKAWPRCKPPGVASMNKRCICTPYCRQTLWRFTLPWLLHPKDDLWLPQCEGRQPQQGHWHLSWDLCRKSMRIEEECLWPLCLLQLHRQMHMCSHGLMVMGIAPLPVNELMTLLNTPTQGKRPCTHLHTS